MLNLQTTADQAAGLRKLMMPDANRLVTIALATPDIQIDASIRLLRAHLGNSQYDKFTEYKPTQPVGLKTKLPHLGKVIICLNSTAPSIKEAYALIKQFSEHTFGQAIGVFVTASCVSQAKTIFYNLSSVSSKHIGVVTELIGFDVPEMRQKYGKAVQQFAMI